MKCKSCGSNFTEKSKQEYHAATGWKDECPACTKKKFENYVGEYLLRIMPVDDLVKFSKEYFGDAQFKALEGDKPDKVATAIATLVYVKKGKQGTKDCSTIGHAIAAFVKYFDDLVKKEGGPRITAGTKVRIVWVLVIGIALISLAIVLVILRY
nr:hypothetical protein [Candidatus Sigynarchaeota archaeon]